MNKEYSTWTAECNLTGHDDLWHLAEATNERHAAIYVIMAETAQEAVDLIVSQVPDVWLTAGETSAPAIRDGWSPSYAEVAGKVPAPHVDLNRTRPRKVALLHPSGVEIALTCAWLERQAGYFIPNRLFFGQDDRGGNPGPVTLSTPPAP